MAISVTDYGCTVKSINLQNLKPLPPSRNRHPDQYAQARHQKRRQQREPLNLKSFCLGGTSVGIVRLGHSRPLVLGQINRISVLVRVLNPRRLLVHPVRAHRGNRRVVRVEPLGPVRIGNVTVRVSHIERDLLTLGVSGAQHRIQHRLRVQGVLRILEHSGSKTFQSRQAHLRHDPRHLGPEHIPCRNSLKILIHGGPVGARLTRIQEIIDAEGGQRHSGRHGIGRPPEPNHIRIKGHALDGIDDTVDGIPGNHANLGRSQKSVGGRIGAA